MQTDKQADWQTYIRTDRQTDQQADRKTCQDTCIQRHACTDSLDRGGGGGVCHSVLVRSLISQCSLMPPCDKTRRPYMYAQDGNAIYCTCVTASSLIVTSGPYSQGCRTDCIIANARRKCHEQIANENSVWTFHTFSSSDNTSPTKIGFRRVSILLLYYSSPFIVPDFTVP